MAIALAYGWEPEFDPDIDWFVELGVIVSQGDRPRMQEASVAISLWLMSWEAATA